MSIKRKLTILLSAVLIVCMCICSFPVFAGTADNTSEENPAWLADVYIRESSTDFVKNKLVPRSEGIYTRTLGGFRKEVEALKEVCNLQVEDLSNAYIKIIEKVYQLMDQTGIFAEYDTMKSYLQDEQKIVFPEDDSAVNKTYVAVAYACLKYDLLYPVVGVHFDVPDGTSINRTVVLIVAALMTDTVPADIETIEEYAILNVKRNLIENGYKVSEDADVEEILMLYKIMMAEKQGYKIKNQDVANYTEEDIVNLNGAYAASVIKMAYDVSPTPEDAYLVLNSADPDAMPALILGLMIKAKGESTLGDDTLEDLFNHACRLGCFNLDHEFYSDIYEYDVYLEHDCKEIWITPFTHAAELGSDKTQYAKVTINGTAVKNGGSHRFALSGDLTKAQIKVVYDDGTTKNNATYTFYIHNGTEPLPEKPNLPLPPIAGGTGGNSGGSSGSSTDSNYNGGEYIFENPEGMEFVPYEIEGGSSLPGFSSSGSNSDLSAAEDGSSSNPLVNEDGKINAAFIIICVVCALALIGGGIGIYYVVAKKKGLPFKVKLPFKK